MESTIVAPETGVGVDREDGRQYLDKYKQENGDV